MQNKNKNCNLFIHKQNKVTKKVTGAAMSRLEEEYNKKR